MGTILTMEKDARGGPGFEVSVGFAADAAGAGIAYAAMRTAGTPKLLRVPFRVKRSDSVEDRDVAYGALRAVAGAIRRNYHGAVRFVTAEEALALDLKERRPLPKALTMPYVALRCCLNRFAQAEVAYATTPQIDDLTARAKAEVSLRVAA